MYLNWKVSITGVLDLVSFLGSNASAWIGPPLKMLFRGQLQPKEELVGGLVCAAHGLWRLFLWRASLLSTLCEGSVTQVLCYYPSWSPSSLFWELTLSHWQSRMYTLHNKSKNLILRSMLYTALPNNCATFTGWNWNSIWWWVTFISLGSSCSLNMALLDELVGRDSCSLIINRVHSHWGNKAGNPKHGREGRTKWSFPETCSYIFPALGQIY